MLAGELQACINTCTAPPWSSWRCADKPPNCSCLADVEANLVSEYYASKMLLNIAHTSVDLMRNYLHWINPSSSCNSSHTVLLCCPDPLICSSRRPCTHKYIKCQLSAALSCDISIHFLEGSIKLRPCT